MAETCLWRTEKCPLQKAFKVFITPITPKFSYYTPLLQICILHMSIAELQNLLAKGIINEREFFSQSEMLLNTYLKDSEEHIEKYAEEISDAEKTLHGNLVSAYEYERDELGRLRDKNYINIA